MEKHKEINIDQFSKDADELFKKYRLETGIIVANYKEGTSEYLLSCVNSNDKKEEAELLYATQELFSLVNLKSDYFSFLTNILKQLREKISKNTPKKEVKLSKKETSLLSKIRNIKNELVLDKEYEKASIYREVEKQILEGNGYDKDLADSLIKQANSLIKKPKK